MKFTYVKPENLEKELRLWFKYYDSNAGVYSKNAGKCITLIHVNVPWADDKVTCNIFWADMIQIMVMKSYKEGEWLKYYPRFSKELDLVTSIVKAWEIIPPIFDDAL